MKLHLISNPQVVDRNTVSGKIGRDELPIQVSRQQKGWQVTLKIVVDGMLQHEDVPDAGEIKAWDELMERAEVCMEQAREFKRVVARHNAMGIFK